VNIDNYIDLFLQESREHLQNMNHELLNLEQNPDDNESLHSIFRYAHTLKGMAATMGFEQITGLNHQMENLLDRLRENKIDLSPEIIDLLFQSVDVLSDMIESVATGSNETFDVESLVRKLENRDINDAVTDETRKVNDNPELELTPAEQNIFNEASEKGLNVFHLAIEIAPDCIMKSVRAFMVINSLEKLGQILKSIPDSQDLEDEKFDNEFFIILTTPVYEDTIQEAMHKISEISIKHIKPFNNTFTNANNRQSNTNSGDYNNTQINQTVRVDIGKLDKLMNLVGELVINKSRLEQIAKTANDSALSETVIQINKITSDLQNITMGARMVPIEQVFNRFPRMVRDLSKELGKDIDLVMEGKETELDRKIIDEIADPLVHLVRNSIDHGIESPEDRVKSGKPGGGTLKLIAKQEGNSIVIIVQDDGRGLNTEDIKEKALEKGVVTLQELEQMDEISIFNLVFIPGFSTAAEVSDISGRGVGLDVVKATIQSLNGSIMVESTPGEGTTFTISLPLTLAIIQALMVSVGSEIYAIPLANIVEITAAEKNEIKKVQGQKVVVLRGNVLRLINLGELLEVEQSQNDMNDKFYVVVIRKNHQQIGLIVNELIGLQEIVISSLGRLLLGTPGISGAAVLGDGSISLIIDISTLF
jgi:two-component system chemotaxis sensor kinase CheA